MQKHLKLPTQSPRVRAENKALWNEARSVERADFYTIGYEGKPTEQLLSLLRLAGVASLIDVRHTPVSMYRPELSKSNFKAIIEEAGMAYIHVPELGVPRTVRARAVGQETREAIWEWYDENIVERYFSRNLHWFLNLGHPVALMCVEADPTECHRHRVFHALERHGLRGFDL
jgi:uncharacterized protein (DUF488 family)